MNITIKALTPDLLEDYLFFFDNVVFTENPDWSACYCFSYHFVGTEEQWDREANRSSVIEFINEKKMTGYLAYHNNKPVGWCNVNDRSNYQRIVKYYDYIDNPDDKACSIVCFLIHPAYRRQGIARKILERICTDYSTKEYDYIEAYPKKGNQSCEKHYHGPLELYEQYNFKVQKESEGHYIVRKKMENKD